MRIASIAAVAEEATEAAAKAAAERGFSVRVDGVSVLIQGPTGISRWGLGSLVYEGPYEEFRQHAECWKGLRWRVLNS